MKEPQPNTRQIRIPEGSLRRLPIYHRLLQDKRAAGEQYISCSTIGRELGLDSTQVRKDIEAAGIVGRPKVGYLLMSLMVGIEEFLGWNNTKDAFLVGAGSLGSALMGYEKFRKFGLNIVAAFENDPQKIGTQVHGREVLPIEKMVELARRMHVHLGVIAVPAPAAQAVADLLVEGGIRALWNFAPVHLRVPEFVILQNEDLYPSLASLSFKLERRMKAEQAAGSEDNARDPGIINGSEVRKSL